MSPITINTKARLPGLLFHHYLTRIIHQKIFLVARRRWKISGRVPEYPEHDFFNFNEASMEILQNLDHTQI